MTDKTAAAAIEELGLQPDEAIKVDRELTKRLPRDNRICICGHALSRHHSQDGVERCFPSRMACVCQKIRPVLEAEDTRVFLRKTSGPGFEHALIRGLASLTEKGKTAVWSVEPVCDKCGADRSQSPIMPVPLTFNGGVARSEEQQSGLHALLCQDCITDLT